MKHAPLSAKQSAFVQYYADSASPTYNNAVQSAIKAGYSVDSARSIGPENLSKPAISEAITAYLATITTELDWNRTTNLTAHYKQVERYEAILAAHPDNLQALQGLNQVLRELNASSNQHKQVIVNEQQGKPQLSEEEREATYVANRAYKLKLTKSG